MTKLLLLVLIVLVAFWLGKMSASAKRKDAGRRNSGPDTTVIDIEPEDK